MELNLIVPTKSVSEFKVSIDFLIWVSNHQEPSLRVNPISLPLCDSLIILNDRDGSRESVSTTVQVHIHILGLGHSHIYRNGVIVSCQELVPLLVSNRSEAYFVEARIVRSH